MKEEYGTDWENDVSGTSKHWLQFLGGFTPTVNIEYKEVKGYLSGDRTYLNSEELRDISNALLEAAQWLEKRAELKMIQDQENKED